MKTITEQKVPSARTVQELTAPNGQVALVYNEFILVTKSLENDGYIFADINTAKILENNVPVDDVLDLLEAYLNGSLG